MLVEDELPVMPIFRYSNFFLFDPHRVTGISSHPRQDQHLYLVDILGDGKGAERPLMLPPRPDGSQNRDTESNEKKAGGKSVGQAGERSLFARPAPCSA
jgi:hypothetical protein